MKERFEELLRIAQGHTVCIQPHDYPDPDALASAFGLQELLRRRGIEAGIGYFGTVDKVNIRLMMDEFEIVPVPREMMDRFDEDAVVINIDVQKNNSNLTDMKGQERVCIDHHPWVTEEKYDIVIHELVGACATIVTELYAQLGEEIPRNVATALLYGIKMDTRNLCAGVTDADIAAFSLLHRIADHDIIQRLDNNSLQISDLRAYGAAIQNIVVYDEIGFVHIPFDCPDGLIASVSNFILALDAVTVAVVYADRNGGLKFSVRSELSEVNAGQLVNYALRGIGNGGGHATMAGGLLYRECMSRLGSDRDTAIRMRFGDALARVTSEEENQ
ncbi:MAG: DHH family phosphoesterase [Lachnospiraceae bacterium]|nr:DHH family phosphoesterase [Lachnospiraceae bacterium]